MNETLSTPVTAYNRALRTWADRLVFGGGAPRDSSVGGICDVIDRMGDHYVDGVAYDLANR